MSEPIRVLLVDDQLLFRTGIAVIIDAQPDMVTVGQAANGHEAIQLVQQIQPDVVLMDIRMPDLDGVEATRQIFAPHAAAARTQPVRVIVLTTFNLDDRAATAIRHGASGFLLKDATPEFLLSAIRTVHLGNAVIAPDDLRILFDGRLQTKTPPPATYLSLTEKEREIMTAIAQGLSNAEIGQKIHLSESTVKTHVGSILRKLGLRDRVQVVVFAHEHALL